jgi:hypothetical protein
MMTKSDVDAELFGESLAFRRPLERSGIRAKVLEVIDLLGVFELVPMHRLQYEGQRALVGVRCLPGPKIRTWVTQVLWFGYYGNWANRRRTICVIIEYTMEDQDAD